jgi:hypothetical protein
MRQILYCFLFLMFTFQSFAQTPCEVSNIWFRRQSQIDSFPIIYGHCDRIDTTIHIVGSDIVSLDSLYPLKYVYTMFIRFTNIKNVRGLQGLDSAGHIHIYDNTILGEIKDLQNLKIVGSVHLLNNVNLADLEGLEMDSVRSISISRNEKLVNLKGLQPKKIQNLGVSDNINMSSLSESGIDSVETLQIGGDYIILKDIETLRPKQVWISNSVSLTDISALNNLKDVSRIRLYLLTNLKNCAIPIICENIDREGFLFGIEYNGVGCRTIEEIKAACLVSSVDLSDEHLLIHPNPFDQFFSLRLPKKRKNNGTFSVYNANGQVILSLGIGYDQEVMSVSTESWPAGMYFYHITGVGSKSSSGKLVKVE